MSEIFSRGALQKYVDAAMQGVPPHHGIVRLKVTLDGKITFTTAARIDDHWLIQGGLSYDMRERLLEGEIEVLASW